MNRSHRSKVLTVLWGAAIGTAARPAVAQPPPPVDVVIHDAPSPHRMLVIEWSPLALIIGRVSINAVIVPADHHAVVLSPFYASTTTAPIYVVDASRPGPYPNFRLPQQTFDGFGGEIGYRYYFAKGGPRGFFAGPSLLVASITAKAQDGSRTPFWDYGLAADIGYEAIVAERVAISLGGGVQYTATSKSIPDQQLPAAIDANSALRPRVLASLGCAF